MSVPKTPSTPALGLDAHVDCRKRRRPSSLDRKSAPPLFLGEDIKSCCRPIFRRAKLFTHLFWLRPSSTPFNHDKAAFRFCRGWSACAPLLCERRGAKKVQTNRRSGEQHASVDNPCRLGVITNSSSGTWYFQHLGPYFISQRCRSMMNQTLRPGAMLQLIGGQYNESRRGRGDCSLCRQRFVCGYSPEGTRRR